MLSYTIDELEFTFTLEEDNNYKINTIKDDVKYEGNSFMKPVGELGLDKIEELLDYVEEKCCYEMLDNNIMLTIPVPFSKDDIIVRLLKENISEVEILRREITKLKQKNVQLEKRIDNLKILNGDELTWNKILKLSELIISCGNDYINFNIYFNLNQSQECYRKLLNVDYKLQTGQISVSINKSNVRNYEHIAKTIINIVDPNLRFNPNLKINSSNNDVSISMNYNINCKLDHIFNPSSLIEIMETHYPYILMRGYPSDLNIGLFNNYNGNNSINKHKKAINDEIARLKDL